MRILIVKTSSMGDVVHALPAVSDMLGAQPGLQVDWLVEAPFAAIPRLHAGVQRVCLEATGIYHLDLALALDAAGVALMVVNPV